MLLSLKFISSKAGKAVALRIQEKMYVFNVFEGFQRYAIQVQFSLASVDALFLTSKKAVPGLMGACMSLSELGKTDLDIVSTFDTKLFTLWRAYTSKTFNPRFLSDFDDKFISVRTFDVNGITNFVVKFPELKGTFHPERMPKNIPKTLYKKLIADGVLVFDGVTYNSADFTDPSIHINDICLVFSELDESSFFGDHLKDVECFFCFTESSWKYFSTAYPQGELGGNFKGVFHVLDNHFVEYEDFYREQMELNKKDKRFLLPCSSGASQVEPRAHLIRPSDEMIYDRRRGCHFVRSEPKTPVETVYVPKLPSIEFLGTGCAIPSKYCNVSAILYQTAQSAVIFDCGEDTATQLLRLHGNLDVMKRLKLVYLSHEHADHALGVATVVRMAECPLLVIAPSDVKKYIEYFDVEVTEVQVQEKITLAGKVNFIATDFLKGRERAFYDDSSPSDGDISKYIQKIEYDEFEIVMCGCPHSKTSASVAIVDRSIGKKISYSGDTIPSRLFTQIAWESDVMIHEATFISEQVKEARKRCHTTVSEARAVFEESESKELLLTHFSNRNEWGGIENSCMHDFFRYTFPEEDKRDS